MIAIGPYTLKLLDTELFVRKLLVVVVATLVLVPLVYYRLYVPALVYIVGLLALHLVFLYTYFSRLPWESLLRTKARFGTRLLAVVFLIYLLAALKFHGSFDVVILNLLAGLAIHTLILAALLTEVQPRPAS